MNSRYSCADILFFHLKKKKIWCWMLLCLGSVVWTVASEAHWLVQAETKRQMVVVCVVYCDCDLTTLLYLLFEVCVCVCACVHVCSCVHACTRKCICVMTEEEMQRPYVHNHQFSLSPLLFLSLSSLLSLFLSGSCWWISAQSKQENKHTDGSALCTAKQC